MSQTVGVIGLGAMGMGMAQSLVRAGFVVKGYDIAPLQCNGWWTVRPAPSHARGWNLWISRSRPECGPNQRQKLPRPQKHPQPNRSLLLSFRRPPPPKLD